MTKRCPDCGITTDIDASAFYETQTGKRCKSCHHKRYFQRGHSRLRAAKMERGQCADCNLKVTYENSSVFDFDHIQEKSYNVSSMATMSDRKFFEEVDKCQLVCSNCHRIRTINRPLVGPRPGRPRKIRDVPPHGPPVLLPESAPLLVEVPVVMGSDQ